MHAIYRDDGPEPVVSISLTEDELDRFTTEQRTLGLRDSTRPASNELFDRLCVAWLQARGVSYSVPPEARKPADSASWGLAPWA